MQSTNKISETIHQIFKIINVVYDPTVISFDNQQLIVAKFKNALELASQIDLSNVALEVWEASSSDSKYNDIADIIHERFDPLLTWKPNLYDITELKESLKADLSGYFDKTLKLDIEIIPQYKNKITELYIQIGLRFLKLNLDLDKIMVELNKKSEILGNEQLKKKYKAAAYNIKLSPDKIQDFTRVIFKLYYHNFFYPLDNKNGITEIDVVKAFENFFDVEIVDTNNFSTDFYDVDNEIYKTNDIVEKKEDIPSSDDTKFQLKSFFTYAAGNYLIENLPKEFKIEYGKSMSILIYVLTNHEPPLLNIPYRKAKMFHEILKAHFKRDIGSYQSIFNYKVDPIYDIEEIEFFKKRISVPYAISKALN